MLIYLKARSGSQFISTYFCLPISSRRTSILLFFHYPIQNPSVSRKLIFIFVLFHSNTRRIRQRNSFIVMLDVIWNYFNELFLPHKYIYACICSNYNLPFCWLSSCIIENNSDQPARRHEIELIWPYWLTAANRRYPIVYFATRTPHCSELQLQQLASLCIWEWEWKWKWQYSGPLKYAKLWWIATWSGWRRSCEWVKRTAVSDRPVGKTLFKTAPLQYCLLYYYRFFWPSVCSMAIY